MANPTTSKFDARRFYSRRSIRLRGYDYRTAGVYFVTMCTFQNVCSFGHIRDCQMRKNDLGKIVCEEWLNIARSRKNVQLDQFVLMPNHLHGLIIITDRSLERSHERIQPARKDRSSTTIKAGSLGAIIGQFKASVTRRARLANIVGSERIWQRNYFEHIVRNEESMNEIRRYIEENPARWHIDDLYMA